MERLTDKRLAIPPGQWQEVAREETRELKEIPVPSMRELYYRLSLYEDTGLEPEEILSAVDMAKVACSLEALNAYKELGSLDRLRELAEADREGRCVVLNMPRKPLVWGDDDQNACLCPYCGKDLMGIPYGERMVLQCPECGQYLDATKVITREEAEATLANVNSGT